jgi:hypothetical protein
MLTPGIFAPEFTSVTTPETFPEKTFSFAVARLEEVMLIDNSIMHAKAREKRLFWRLYIKYPHYDY